MMRGAILGAHGWRVSERSRCFVGGHVGRELAELHERAAPRLTELPGDIQRSLIAEYYRLRECEPFTGTPDVAGAGAWLTGEVSTLEAAHLGVAFDDALICEHAKRWAALCERMGRVEVMQEWARSKGIVPPAFTTDAGRVSAAKRLACPRWWRRALRRTWSRGAESHLRGLGHVQRRRALYVTDRTVRHRRGRLARNRKILESLTATSDAGDQLNLWDVAQTSQANPALRRAELMVRMRGFEEHATAHGDVADFWTLTAPSAFHATKESGERNPLWNATSPREAQAWLNKIWSRARAALKRRSIHVYGFRIAEPHHDGTPHWHLLIFMGAADRAAVRVILRELWLSEYGEERGAASARSKVIAIDAALGTAAGYVAKYVAKNIDGHEVGADYEAGTPTDAIVTCERVAAWAAVHGIRQFQQIGGPRVTVYRELRRLRHPVGLASIEGSRAGADAGDWAAFTQAQGGTHVDAQKVTLWCERTGELTQYEELKPPQIVGVQAGEEKIKTRWKIWRVARSRSSLGPVSLTVRGSSRVPTVASARAHASSEKKVAIWMH